MELRTRQVITVAKMGEYSNSTSPLSYQFSRFVLLNPLAFDPLRCSLVFTAHLDLTTWTHYTDARETDAGFASPVMPGN